MLSVPLGVPILCCRGKLTDGDLAVNTMMSWEIALLLPSSLLVRLVLVVVVQGVPPGLTCSQEGVSGEASLPASHKIKRQIHADRPDRQTVSAAAPYRHKQPI